jgi:hypothetical protein
MDDTMKKYEPTTSNECVNMNVMSVRNTYSPKLRLLPKLVYGHGSKL